MNPTTDYLPLFAPRLCECGAMPTVVEMPNYTNAERWQVLCEWNHLRVFSTTMDGAIEKFNEAGR